MHFNTLPHSTSAAHLHCLRDNLKSLLQSQNKELIYSNTNIPSFGQYMSAPRCQGNELEMVRALPYFQEFRPYELASVEGMGWVLIATQNIPAHSLLCEYVGEFSLKDAQKVLKTNVE